jgi:hypothetical protein
MIRGNAYVTTKTALEAHTFNLAAEQRGTSPFLARQLPICCRVPC